MPFDVTLKGDSPTGPRLGRVLGRLDDDRRGLRAMAETLRDSEAPGDKDLCTLLDKAASSLLTAMMAVSDVIAEVNAPR